VVAALNPGSGRAEGARHALDTVPPDRAKSADPILVPFAPEAQQKTPRREPGAFLKFGTNLRF
jgi:hypothetical protein